MSSAICLVVLYVYANADPSNCEMFPVCPFYKITGLKCAGCGGQRALHCLLNGEMRKAFSYNSYLFFIIPMLACGLITRISNKSLFAYVIVGVTLVYVFARNVVSISM